MNNKPHDSLDDSPFSYQLAGDGIMRITWRGRLVVTLGDKEAAKLLARLAGADQRSIQLALAKVTGNFKRGNERR